MKIGLVGFPGSGKSAVFNALTGQAVDTGYGGKSGKAHIGVVKVPDHRVDALAALYSPKKTTYAEVTFTDVAADAAGAGLDRAVLNSMREVDALCQVVRAFDSELTTDAPRPLGELLDLETECILADLEIVERRIERLAKDHSDPRELELMKRLAADLEAERPLRGRELSAEQLKMIVRLPLPHPQRRCWRSSTSTRTRSRRRCPTTSPPRSPSAGSVPWCSRPASRWTSPRCQPTTSPSSTSRWASSSQRATGSCAPRSSCST